MSDDQLALKELRRVSRTRAVHGLSHYLYLPSQAAAAEVAARLRAVGFSTEERFGVDGVNWLVLAKHDVVPSEPIIEAARQLMEGLTGPRDGEYDGWEAEVL